jgi:hypothetical protein
MGTIFTRGRIPWVQYYRDGGLPASARQDLPVGLPSAGSAHSLVPRGLADRVSLGRMPGTDPA